MIYYISDLHLGHTAIIHMCNRPFNSIEEMNETLINNWNAKVKATDEVYFLGDFSYKIQVSEAVNLFKQLNGKKYVIKGNHDKKSFIQKLREENLVEWARDYAEIVDSNHMVILSHCPFETWNGEYHGSIHIHGHIHEKTISYKPNRYNVSVEAINYTPITLDELIRKNRCERH